MQVRRAAELDVAEAQVWYETQRAGLGADFHSEFPRFSQYSLKLRSFTQLCIEMLGGQLSIASLRDLVSRSWRGGHGSRLYARSTEPQQGHLSFSVEDSARDTSGDIVDRVVNCVRTQRRCDDVST